jgi:hypothetical protein
VPAGRHELTLVNDTLGYRAELTVNVLAGQVLPVKPSWPKGRLDVNAEPWAEVWVDGKKMGQTPLGGLSVAIGPHEVMFRHPQLGEQHHAITVTTRAPVHMSVDLRR